MHEAIQAITDELKRLRASGVRTVAVSEEALQSLRRAAGTGGRETVATPAVVPVPEREAEVPKTVRATPSPAAPALSPRSKVNPEIPVIPAAPPPFSLPAGTKRERWDALKAVIIGDAVCKSQLRPGKQVVVGSGDLDAELFLCGEAPGAEEEVQAEPFVGPAGQKLTQILTAMGLSRDRVYIGNLMNWRPRLADQEGPEQSGNRPPSDTEMAYCLPFLRAQLEIVKPKVIVALGGTAAKGLLGPGSFRQVGEVRGRWLAWEGVPLRVTYHPSYLLRQDEIGRVAGMRAKRAVWEDMLEVMEKLGLPVSDKQRGYFLKP
ncbi:uracil-DNA glycosylase [Nibricoccus sp. IMCC34717]|uniref:uracil-DNA glycosylase n=1 Tax=Nibricoccus sp. IMCC34717 TaxID=3034021 RepID=UPI00384F52FE